MDEWKQLLQAGLGLVAGIAGTAGYFMDNWRPMTPEERAEDRERVERERHEWPGER